MAPVDDASRRTSLKTAETTWNHRGFYLFITVTFTDTSFVFDKVLKKAKRVNPQFKIHHVNDTPSVLSVP